MQTGNKNLSHQYHVRFSSHEEYRKTVWGILVSDFFHNFVPQSSYVLDLGAGWGEFINHINAGRKFAMDMNPKSGKKFDDNVVFFNQDCSKPWPFEDGTLDIVFTSNFLEHLLTKELIELTISEALRCLKEEGKIICMGPNIRHVPGGYWDFWDHHIALTENSLSELSIMKGFSIDKCIGRFLPYSMSKGWVPPSFFVRLYLKTPLLWKIFGKQFLVIGSKKR